MEGTASVKAPERLELDVQRAERKSMRLQQLEQERKGGRGQIKEATAGGLDLSQTVIKKQKIF